MYKYKISVIMPVYNSALYIKEAMDSVVGQSIGIENIQLIIVNDGSTDNSAEIIKEYYAKYPKNIIYVEQENKGVSEARNEGIKHVEGKYTAFLDPDDTLSPDTYLDLYTFFEKNYDKTSVVSYPIYFFGITEGAHPLNDKFEQGNRIINLLSEGTFQLHITSSIIKSEIAKGICFKRELCVSEDAEALLKILIDTPTLGVVTTARYNYRKHLSSVISNVSSNKGWYFDHITHYFEAILSYAKKKYSAVPEFVQRAMMYDISWKLAISKKPEILTESQRDTLLERIFEIIAQLDDSVILKSTVLSCDERCYLVAKKHNDSYEKSDNDIFISGTEVRASLYPVRFEFIDLCGDKIKLSCRIITPYYHKIQNAFVMVDGTKINAKPKAIETKKKLFGMQMLVYNGFDFEIDKALISNRVKLEAFFEIDRITVKANNVIFGRFFPLEEKYRTSFYEKNGILLTHKNCVPVLEKSTLRDIKRHKKAFKRELWKSNGFAERKAVIARALAGAYKKFVKKPIWIISDRLSQADDNGEALFGYLNKTKFKQARYFYAIRRGNDFSRLKKQGRVLDRASLKYKIVFLASDVIISSQGEDFVINPFDYYWQPYKDILSDKSFVFLQHGVIKDDLSSWLNRYNKNIKGFVTSAVAEYKSILEQEKYGYSENELWLTGLPRFDNLADKQEKIIAIMPTWRRYLVGGISIETGKWTQSDTAKSSDLVRFYEALLNDNRLLSCLEKNDCRAWVIPHPNMKSLFEFTDTSERISVKTDISYRTVYEKSSLAVSDYSSAVFDLAYLEKPIIYAQFDKEKFFSGAHTYEKGYFDYERDGFGPVTYTLDETVSAIIDCIESGFVNDRKYIDRINSFFAYRDSGNCERVVKKILELGAKNDNSK